VQTTSLSLSAFSYSTLCLPTLSCAIDRAVLNITMRLINVKTLKLEKFLDNNLGIWNILIQCWFHWFHWFHRVSTISTHYLYTMDSPDVLTINQSILIPIPVIRPTVSDIHDTVQRSEAILRRRVTQSASGLQCLFGIVWYGLQICQTISHLDLLENFAQASHSRVLLGLLE
jgi:hypothetical protein